MPNTYFDTAKITGSVSSLIPVIDDFEDQDFSEYAGDTGSASIVTSPVANDTYAAAIAAGEKEIRSTSGLDNYPAQGDVFRWNTYIPTDGRPRFYWGVQDASNFYFLEYNQPNSLLRFVKQEAGGNTEIDAITVNFDTGAYSETEVEWRTNGRHIIRYFDSTGTEQGTIDVTDTTYTSGGVGWGEYSALQTGIVDDFEDGDLSEYGTQAEFSISTARVRSGTYSLEYDGTNLVTLGSSSGLDIYPKAGSRHKVYCYLENDGIEWNIRFAETDSDSGWLITAKRATSESDPGSFRLFHSGHNRILDDEDTTTPPQDEWIEFDFYWYDDYDVVTCDIYREDGTFITQLAGANPGSSGGQIAFTAASRDSNAKKMYWDDWEVVSANNTSTDTTGLKTWYKFDEGSGSTLNDSATSYYDQSAQDASLVNGGTWSTDAPGTTGSVELDGTDDYIRSLTFPGADGSYSVSFWVKSSTAGGNNELLWDMTRSSNRFYHRLREPSSVSLFSDADSLGTGVDVADGAWHHIVLSVNRGENTTIYIDGVQQAQTSTTSYDLPSVDMAFGYSVQQQDNGPFPGKISEIRIYAYGISQSRAQYLYNNPV